MARQDRRASVGDQFGDVHHDGGERFGADESTFDQPVRQEERNHDRPDASQQGGEKTKDGADDGKRAQRESYGAACAGAAVNHHADQKNAEKTGKKRQRRRGEEKTAEKRGGHAGQSEPTDDRQVQLSSI